MVESNHIQTRTMRTTLTSKFLSGILPLLLVSLGLSSSSYAQGRGGTPEEQKAAFDEGFVEMAKTIALDDESAPLVKDILWSAQMERREVMMSLRNSGNATGNLGRAGMRDKMADLDKQTIEKLSKVLTDVQMEKYQEMMSSRQRGRQGGQRRGQRQGNPQ